MALCPNLSVGLPLFEPAPTESKRDAFEILDVLEMFDRSIKDHYFQAYNFVRAKYLTNIRLLESASPIVTKIHQCAWLTTGSVRDPAARENQIASVREPAFYFSVTDYLAVAYRRRRIH